MSGAGPWRWSLVFAGLLAILAAAPGVACKKAAPPTAGDSTAPEATSADARIVYKDAAGRVLTEKDLEGATGTVQWEIRGTWTAPSSEAKALHEQGRDVSSRGEYARGLELFERAHRLAPTWPYPVYDAAFTYLLQGDTAKAEERYAEVDRLAPRGFFTAKASLDCLRRERGGALPPAFCKAFAELEWADDRARKRAVLEGIVSKYPSFPGGWKELCVLLEDEDARLHAIEKGLEHGPDGETRGILLINRALVLDKRGDHEGARRILGDLALDPSSTLGTETLAKAALARLRG